MIYKFAYISKQNSMCNKFAFVNSETDEYVVYTNTNVNGEQIDIIREWSHGLPIQLIKLDSLTSWHVLIERLDRDPKMKKL